MVEQTGQLTWNLPSEVDYSAGSPLSLEVTVTNIISSERTFQLLMAYFDSQTGEQLAPAVVMAANGADTFDVSAGSSIVLAGSLYVEKTNIILGVFLFDVGNEEVVDQVQTLLREPGSIITGLVTAILPILGIAIMAPMFISMFKKESK